MTPRLAEIQATFERDTGRRLRKMATDLEVAILAPHRARRKWETEQARLRQNVYGLPSYQDSLTRCGYLVSDNQRGWETAYRLGAVRAPGSIIPLPNGLLGGVWSAR